MRSGKKKNTTTSKQVAINFIALGHLMAGHRAACVAVWLFLLYFLEFLFYVLLICLCLQGVPRNTHTHTPECRHF